MVFAVIGGDERLVRLSRLLAEDGHSVLTFAQETADGTGAAARSAAEAAAAADCVILPLPLSASGGILNAPFSEEKHWISDIFRSIGCGKTVLAGNVDAAAAEIAREMDIELTDYFLREEFAVANAVLTAEGAIDIIMHSTPTSIWGSKILVVGFGRIGKALAYRLRALGAHVSVSSRTEADRAWCRAYGYDAEDTRSLGGHFGAYDVVINTVPVPVVDSQCLKELKPGALCIDLASRPGGVDMSAAEKLGIHTIWALGLPGKAAPESAGAAIRDTIYNILREQGRI